MHWTAAKDALRTLMRQPRVGIVSDVDGTLSEIVDQPDAATVLPRCRDALRRLSAQIPLTAFVSGRAALDVQRMVNLPGVVIVGNHGLEWLRDGRVDIAPAAAASRPALEAAADDVRAQAAPGVMVEDKGATLSVHYRRTADPDAAAAALRPLLHAVADQRGLRLFEGRMIFELRPPVALNKGTALHTLAQQYALDGVLYLGDDVTDVDALRVVRALRDSGAIRALGVGVVADETPESVRATADVLAEGVQDVAALLEWLLSASSASTT